MADITNQLQAAAGATVALDTDPNFNQTVLLLHGDGTNGAQNNTFLDGSTNNFTITRNGNTTQGRFSPFSLAAGEWSNYFDGTGDFLAFSPSSDFGSSDFTVSGWFYKTVSGTARILSARDNNTGLTIGINSSNALTAFYGEGVNIISGGSVTLNEWHYFVLVRSSGTATLYFNGVSLGTSNWSSKTFNSTAYRIGSSLDSRGEGFSGYLSNIRTLTSAETDFTVPTAPLTAITNTSLLTCQSNRFVDNSSNNLTITRNGDVRVTPFSPFAPSAAYDPAVNGGSGYFDGTGDYLSVANNAALQFGTGDFTIEGWVYIPVLPSNNDGIVAKRSASTETGTWSIDFDTSGVLRYRILNATVLTYNIGTIKLGEWAHFAVSKESGTTRTFLNGVAGATSTDVTSINGGTNALVIGRGAAGAEPICYLSDIRVVNGSAVYTSSFTPPTAPLTAITNTSLLCNFTNAGIFDNTGKNNLETVGNAQIDTTTKKFGTGSLEFDGTGDWLVIADTPELRFETAPFTVEFWVYFNNSNSAVGLVSKGGSSTGWGIARTDTNNLRFNYGSSQLNSTATFSTSTWYYIAVVREGTGTNQTKMYIDGVNDGTATVTTNFNQTDPMYIGANRVAQAAANAFIDDLRITKGVARYTANFTAPTKAFPDQ